MLGLAPLFRSLDDVALGRVNEQCRAVACAPGEVVYRQGDPADRLYVVATGAVKLVRHGPDGTPVLHDVVAPGETFGSLHALGDDRLVHEAVALRPGCLLLLTADAFHHVMRTETGVAEAALRLTADRLREAQGTVQALSTLPVEGRLAATLLRLARKVGEEGADGVRLGVAPTQVDLAAMTGTSPESVSRVFARWRAAGWIATGPGGPVLRAPEALGRLADGVA